MKFGSVVWRMPRMLKSVAGTPVPFNPLRIPSLPIHSRRVGLRTIPSIGGKVLCEVNIVVQENTTPNATHMVTIDGVNYNNGDTAVLRVGDHTLTWTSGNNGVFSSWAVSGKLSVDDESAETTTLTVTCGGTLTLTLLACPSGEQIINGGFETVPPYSPPSGWDYEVENCFESVDWSQHGGSRSGHLYCTNSIGVQTLNTPLPVECVDKFEFYARGDYDGACRVIVTYTDDTTTTHDFTIIGNFDYGPSGYTLYDMKPYLTAGKTIKKIGFNEPEQIDLCIDDVTLTGSG